MHPKAFTVLLPSRSKKGCPAFVGKSAVVTHSGDPCRAASLLPIAMGLQCTGFHRAGTRPDPRLSPQAVRTVAYGCGRYWATIAARGKRPRCIRRAMHPV